jgi:hypothetical protein
MPASYEDTNKPGVWPMKPGVWPMKPGSRSMPTSPRIVAVDPDAAVDREFQ